MARKRATSRPRLIYTGPIHQRIDREDHLKNSWSLPIPVILTTAGERPKPDVEPQAWIIDTGCSFEAFAWINHLELAEIDFIEAKEEAVYLFPSSGIAERAWLCKACVWLAKNDREGDPFRLPLLQGLCCTGKEAENFDPSRHRAVIGMRLLIRLFRMEVHFANRQFSLWSRDR
jgi:hypothetical protein